MKNPIDLHIGQRVRHRRWLMGMTQQQLADAIGIRFQQVQKYESGANRISAARLWDIARALGAPVSFFYVEIAGGAGASSDEPMDNKETFELVRAYYGMQERTRHSLLALARAMNGDESDERPRLVEVHQPAGGRD
jgi:transcriptional regulator with XRE-family HTH domain